MSLQRGFSLVEIILVLGVFALLLSISITSFSGSQQRTAISTTVTTLIADIRQQQMKAMLGDTGGGSSAVIFGIYFEPNQYTLFHGASYTPNDPTNFTVSLEKNVQLEPIGFPGSVVQFAKQTGEMIGYATPSAFVTIKNTTSPQTKTIRMNRLGVIISGE